MFPLLLFLILNSVSISSDAAIASTEKTQPVVKQLDSPWQKQPVNPVWSGMPNLPVAAHFVAGANLNGKYYQFCGLGSGSTAYNRAQIWDGSAWSASSLTSPGGGIYAISAAVWNNKIIISGGYTNLSGGTYNYTSIYDPDAGTWTQSTAMGHANIGNTAMAEVGGKCYMFGGFTGSNVINEVYGWTPGDIAMQSLAPMPEARADSAAATWNGKIYVIGGRTNSQTANDNVWEYNPVSNSWALRKRLITQRRNATAVTMGDKIYVMGGQSNIGYTNTVEIIDPVLNTVSFGMSMANLRGEHASAGYLIGGSNTIYSGVIIVSGGYLPGTVLNTAESGDVSGVQNLQVQPISLGLIKAAFH